MSGTLDQHLGKLCSSDEIKRLYTAYKRSKLDRLHAENVETLADWKIGTGASLTEVLALEEWEAGFPAYPSRVLEWGNERKEVALIRIPMGADGVTYQAFENTINHQAIQIANRVRMGKYLFYPFRDVAVLKHPLAEDRGPTITEVKDAIDRDEVRILSVASIRDAIVQRMLSEVLASIFEAKFATLDGDEPVSFGYRPCKSASIAAVMVRRHLKAGFVHVLDADLSRFFDTIPRKTLLTACADIVNPIENPLTYSLLKRFVYVARVHYLSYHWARDAHGYRIGERVFLTKRPRTYDGKPQRDHPQRYSLEAGIPQGGVISGMLANLYLHRFDEWVVRDLSQQIPLRYVRYADDFVLLARYRMDLLSIYENVREQLDGEVNAGGFGLHMHPLSEGENAKTRNLNANTDKLKFVGFEISPTALRAHPDNIERAMREWKEAVTSEIDIREEYPDAQQRLRVLIHRRLRHFVIGYVDVQKCRHCGKPRCAYRSRIAFFSVVTDWQQIRALDKWMRKQVYEQFREELPELTRHDLTELGLPSLIRQYHRIRKLKHRPCPGCANSRAGDSDLLCVEDITDG